MLSGAESTPALPRPGQQLGVAEGSGRRTQAKMQNGQAQRAPYVLQSGKPSASRGRFGGDAFDNGDVPGRFIVDGNPVSDPWAPAGPPSAVEPLEPRASFPSPRLFGLAFSLALSD